MDRCTNRERERERLHWKENNMDRCTNRERERETALEGEQYGQMYK